MKHILIWLLVWLIAYAVSFIGVTVLLKRVDVPRETTKATTMAPTLDHEQKAWLGSLEYCESRGNPKAINPKDRDNTPSYGLLQFKPSTFEYFAEKYGIATTSEGYMDPDVQEAIVTHMILYGHIDWHLQFPVCTKYLGLPPK